MSLILVPWLRRSSRSSPLRSKTITPECRVSYVSTGQHHIHPLHFAFSNSHFNFFNTCRMPVANSQLLSGSTQEPCRTITSHRTNRNLEQKMNGNIIQKTLKLLFVAQPRQSLQFIGFQGRALESVGKVYWRSERSV